MTRGLSTLLASVLLATASGCAGDASSGSGSGVEVLATTTVLGDLTRAVAGDAAAVTTILQPNTDAHGYEPRPDDVRAAAEAALVVASGNDLDPWISEVVDQSGTEARVLDVSARLEVRRPGEPDGERAARYDPHWWHDPRNVETAVAGLRDALAAADPARAATFAANAREYLARVRALDSAVARCVAGVPRERRRLVTDHDAFGYYAARYGLDVVGAVVPSQTTQAQASAGELAALSRTIEREGVRAVFPEQSVPPKLAEALARQSGAVIGGRLYGDGLGPPGSPGETYLGMLGANTEAIVAGLTGRMGRCSLS